MEIITANKQKYTIFGKTKGSNTNKWHRAAKLVYRYDELTDKFERMVEKGMQSNTEHSRLAMAVLLMMQSGIRVGNEGSAEGYMTKPHPYSTKEPEFVQTYGLTTMKKGHVVVTKRAVHLNFLGKKQVENSFTITDPLLKVGIKSLLKNGESDKLFGITDYQMKKFIKKYVGKAFTPKDFRCMRANMYAYEAMKAYGVPGETKKELRAYIKHICTSVSTLLNNTPGVCRKSYISEQLFTHILN